MISIVWDIGTKEIKERKKASNLIADYFSITFINLEWLACMLYFHV